MTEYYFWIFCVLSWIWTKLSNRNAHVTKSTLPTGTLPDNLKEQGSWYFFCGFLLLLYSLLTTVVIIGRERMYVEGGGRGEGCWGRRGEEGGSCLAVASAFFRELQRTTVIPVLNEQHMTLVCTSLPTPPRVSYAHFRCLIPLIGLLVLLRP